MEKENKYAEIFTDQILSELFPVEKSNVFFELLYGDAEEGAYDIGVTFAGYRPGKLDFLFNLRKRPGKCLACNLTYGLPEVFTRHPALDVKGLVGKIDGLLDGKAQTTGWKLGSTREKSRELHAIPLEVSIKEDILSE